MKRLALQFLTIRQIRVTRLGFFATDGAFGFISTSFAYDFSYTIPAGDTLRLKYRMYLYCGDVFTVDLWACYDAYTNKGQ